MASYLLLENGDNLLLESGDDLLLEVDDALVGDVDGCDLVLTFDAATCSLRGSANACTLTYDAASAFLTTLNGRC